MTNAMHTVLTLWFLTFNIINYHRFLEYGKEGYDTGNVEVVCKNEYEWKTTENVRSQLFLASHMVLGITSII